jgi:coenzyme F420-reducing hydrogenase delta subunit/ferredoxin
MQDPMSESLPRRHDPSDSAATGGAPNWQPNVVAMVCRWCSYAGADLAGTSRLTYPASVRLVRFPCTGRMDPLFIIKAFDSGADGVLVSGCHPGDCHYVQGNLYARRRFAVFKALMEFVGLDPRRLHFSWVSASEGAKWVKVVEDVTAAVRAVGPASRGNGVEIVRPPGPEESARQPASEAERRALTGRLRELAAGLFDEGTVSTILGYQAGTLPGRAVAGFASSREETGRLIWDERCYQNLSAYLPRVEADKRKIGVVVKKCDAATVVGLLQEKQLRREDLHLIGVACAGVWEHGGLAAKCRSCDGAVSPACDVRVTPEAAETTAVEHEPDPRDAAIAFLESVPPEARWGFWQAEFKRCIRCYACRAVCPLCYCDTCIADKHRPQWISPAIDEKGNMAWNLVRAFHLAGRCTGCDECARVCPADIRIDLLNRKLAVEVERRFGYRPGEDPDA